MILEREIIIQVPLKVVYEAYADPLLWKDVLEDVTAVKVNYNDGFHQDFEMSVHRPTGEETIRAIRFCFVDSSIEMFQTQPPPYFKTMKGIWTFLSRGTSTLVRASRDFELKDNVDFNHSLLGLYLEKNLFSFKNWLER